MVALVYPHYCTENDNKDISSIWYNKVAIWTLSWSGTFKKFLNWLLCTLQSIRTHRFVRLSTELYYCYLILWHNPVLNNPCTGTSSFRTNKNRFILNPNQFSNIGGTFLVQLSVQEVPCMKRPLSPDPLNVLFRITLPWPI